MNTQLTQLQSRGTAQVVPKLLTDGSLVYDVQVLDGHNIVEINAISERHAIECAATIRTAIEMATGMFVSDAELHPPSVEQIQRDNPHIDGQTRVEIVRTNKLTFLAIVRGYSTEHAREARADYVWSEARQRWELGAN